MCKPCEGAGLHLSADALSVIMPVKTAYRGGIMKEIRKKRAVAARMIPRRDVMKIGGGAIIAACSVAVKDIPPYTVYGGNPAKFIKAL